MFKKNVQLILLLPLLFLFACHKGTPAMQQKSGLLDDIAEIRKTNRHAHVDISNIVSRYVKTGESINEGKKYLETLGFSTSFGKDSTSQETYLEAVRKQDAPPLFLFDKYVIYLNYANGKVTHILARIDYQAP